MKSHKGFVAHDRTTLQNSFNKDQYESFPQQSFILKHILRNTAVINLVFYFKSNLKHIKIDFLPE